MANRSVSLRPLLPLLVGCLLQAPASFAQQVQAPPLYPDLGSHGYPLSIRNSLAQAYFDQGLRLYYAFNHAEAIRAFRHAASLDPSCALCPWGEALAWGPNINLPMDREAGLQAWAALQKARAKLASASAKERDLIEALSRRYAADPPEDRSQLDAAWADALEQLVRRYPNDMDLRTLRAEALMNLNPWRYWNRDGSARENTAEILRELETVLRIAPDHPGANHFYIHAIEETQPERAVQVAERLASLMPGAGHLVHMPGHIYVRVGRYRDAIAANEQAVHADETFIRDQRPAYGIYLAGYYPHNYDFLAFAASMIGRQEQALAATETLRTLSPDDMLRAEGMTFLQHHRTRHLQMKVRFARWQLILAEPPPPEDLGHARGIWAYARGRALIARAELDEAGLLLEELAALAADPELSAQRLEFNTSGSVLAIARDVLAAQLAAAAGDLAAARQLFESAVAREDAMVYGEPPEWTIPVRQDFGVFLLQAGEPAAAERIFREDLDRFPANGWSLHGLAASLGAQGRQRDAAATRAQFQRMWEGQDPPPPVTAAAAGQGSRGAPGR
jgi:tetratricopeptide (TPR) repeat protein